MIYNKYLNRDPQKYTTWQPKTLKDKRKYVLNQ